MCRSELRFRSGLCDVGSKMGSVLLSKDGEGGGGCEGEEKEDVEMG